MKSITAGTPYIVKWEEGSSIDNPTFNSVKIEYTYLPVEADVVTFHGNYSPVGVGEEGDNTILYFGADNKLCYPNAAMTIGSQRAYFQLADWLVDSSMGDVNGDGKISVTDVMMLVNHILGNTSDSFIEENADVNGDGKISVTDVMVLVKKILQGNQTISNIIVNGADGITFGGGGTGPARAGENNLWDAEEDDPK